VSQIVLVKLPLHTFLFSMNSIYSNVVYQSYTFVLSLAPYSINQKIFTRTHQQWQTFVDAFGISFQLEGLFIWLNKILLIFLWSNQIAQQKNVKMHSQKFIKYSFRCVYHDRCSITSQKSYEYSYPTYWHQFQSLKFNQKFKSKIFKK